MRLFDLFGPLAIWLAAQRQGGQTMSAELIALIIELILAVAKVLEAVSK